MEIKVWVIAPDKKEADEYVVLPVDLQPGSNPAVALALQPGLPLRSRLTRSSL